MHNIAVQLCEVYTKSEVVHSLMLVPLHVVQLRDYLRSKQWCNFGLELLCNQCAMECSKMLLMQNLGPFNTKETQWHCYPQPYVKLHKLFSLHKETGRC